MKLVLFKKNYFLALLSGSFLCLSFPHIGNLSLFSCISLVPLLFAEHYLHLKQQSTFRFFPVAYLCFFVYNLGATWWIAYADLNGAILAILANSLVMAFFFFLFHRIRRNFEPKTAYLGLLFLWISFEYMHYHWELSWPWLNLGNIFANRPAFVQWYEYTGVLGGTAWILLLNLLFFKILKERFLNKLAFKNQSAYLFIAFIVFFVPLCFSLFRYYSYKEKSKPLELVVTQPNINPYTEKFGPNNMPVKEQLDCFLNEADSLVDSKTAFVLAPETAIPYEIAEENFTTSDVFRYLQERVGQWKGTGLFVGASTTKFYEKKHSSASRKLSNGGYYESYNTSLLINKVPNVHFIHKSKLVLGVEIIPFARFFPWLESLALNMGGSFGSLGIANKAELLGNDSLQFVPIVCYESIYGAYIGNFVKLGGQALFIITNDGWWDNTPGYQQHFDFARLRAIETRRAVARSANTGISGFINQRGDIIKKTKWDEKTALKGTIQANSHLTFYTRYGDWLGYWSAFPALVLLLVSSLKTLRRKGRKLG